VNFRAVPVSAGRHEVAFRYRPASVRVGAAISAVVAVVMVVAGVLWWRRGRVAGRRVEAAPSAQTAAPPADPTEHDVDRG
jgi:hypothetical protein